MSHSSHGSAAARVRAPESAMQCDATSCPTLDRLADADHLPAVTREVVRTLVGAFVERLLSDVERVQVDLSGPDPEFGLYELLDVARSLESELVPLDRDVRSALGPRRAL